jgi:hypothetical protein
LIETRCTVGTKVEYRTSGLRDLGGGSVGRQLAVPQTANFLDIVLLQHSQVGDDLLHQCLHPNLRVVGYAKPPVMPKCRSLPRPAEQKAMEPLDRAIQPR